MKLVEVPTWSDGPKLTEAISAAKVELYGAFCGHDRTTATTHINDKILVCVLKNILTDGDDALVADGARVRSSAVASRFQTDTKDELTHD